MKMSVKPDKHFWVPVTPSSHLQCHLMVIINIMINIMLMITMINIMITIRAQKQTSRTNKKSL